MKYIRTLWQKISDATRTLLLIIMGIVFIPIGIVALVLLCATIVITAPIILVASILFAAFIDNMEPWY